MKTYLDKYDVKLPQDRNAQGENDEKFCFHPNFQLFLQNPCSYFHPDLCRVSISCHSDLCRMSISRHSDSCRMSITWCWCARGLDNEAKAAATKDMENYIKAYQRRQ